MYFLIILFLILSSADIKAQSDSALKNADARSYELYNAAKWNELISYCENALIKKIDFIYLRVRLGIAYYETGKYFDAIVNLKKAYDLGYRDPYLTEHLYYSYIQTGRTEDADYYFSKLPVKIKKRIKPLGNQFISEFDINGGSGFSNDASENSSTDLDGQDNVYGEQIISDNYFFLNAGFKQLPVNWLNATYNYTFLDLQKTKEIMFNNNKIFDDYSQYQHQFFLKTSIRAGDGFVISTSGHYIYTKDNTIYAQYDSLSNNNGTLTNDAPEYYYSITNKETTQDNFVLSLSLSKQFYIYKSGIHGSFSYLNGNHQTQLGAFLTAYPTKKNTFYTFSDLTLQNQNDVLNLIFFQSAGGKIYKELWLEAFATIGNMNNYNEQNGLLVYNNPDVIKYKFGTELNYFFNKNLSASLVYVYQQREKSYLTYTITGFSNNLPVAIPEYRNLNYSVNTILAGLKIYF